VEWAAAEAARRGAELRLVRAFSWTTSERPIRDGGRVAQYRDELLKFARSQVARAARIAADVRPEVETTTQVAVGAPIEVLGSEARRAQLLVLGDRGLGGLAGLLLGSVAVGLAAHGACPVVIVRGERAGAGNDESPVVVGIDDSPISEAALAFAFDAAAARGVGLVVVHAWSPTAIDDALAPAMDWDAATAEEDALLAERLAGWEQKHPEVAVRRTVVRNGAVRSLVATSREAQLVVVGLSRAWQRNGTVVGVGQPRCPARFALPRCHRATGDRLLSASRKPPGGVEGPGDTGRAPQSRRRREQAALSVIRGG
jgi:nucleotide-binding universal stress UspA family protein